MQFFDDHPAVPLATLCVYVLIVVVVVAVIVAVVGLVYYCSSSSSTTMPISVGRLEPLLLPLLFDNSVLLFLIFFFFAILSFQGIFNVSGVDVLFSFLF